MALFLNIILCSFLKVNNGVKKLQLTISYQIMKLLWMEDSALSHINFENTSNTNLVWDSQGIAELIRRRCLFSLWQKFGFMIHATFFAKCKELSCHCKSCIFTKVSMYVAKYQRFSSSVNIFRKSWDLIYKMERIHFALIWTCLFSWWEII